MISGISQKNNNYIPSYPKIPNGFNLSNFFNGNSSLFDYQQGSNGLNLPNPLNNNPTNNSSLSLIRLLLNILRDRETVNEAPVNEPPVNETKMTDMEAAKILNDNLDMFDQAAGIGKKDYLITRQDLEAIAKNTSPEFEQQRKAAQYMLNNQKSYNALDTSAFGGKTDAVIGGTDLKVYLEKQGLKNVANSSDFAPWAVKNTNTAPNTKTTAAPNTNHTANKPAVQNTNNQTIPASNTDTNADNTQTKTTNTIPYTPPTQNKGVGSNDTGSSAIIQAQNKNYFVDSVNGSDSNDGSSPDKAWKSLAKVNSGGFKPGDVVNFARGSKFDAGGGKSALYVKDSGTADKPITFRSYGTGAKPEFIGDAKQQYSNSILTNNASNVVFDGLKVTGAGEYGIHVTAGSNNNIIENCEATNVGVGFGIRGDNNKVTHNDIHDLKLVVNTQGGDDDYGAVGAWILNANNNEISYNNVINAVGQSHDYGTDGGAFELSGDASNTKIIGNYVKNTDGFMESSQGSANGVTANTLIADNIVEDVRLFTCLHTTDHFKVNYENFQVINNTITDTPSNLNQMFDFAGSKLSSNIFIEKGNKLIAK